MNVPGISHAQMMPRLFVTTFLLISLFCVAARGINLPNYDLDSLAYLSKDIVQAEVIHGYEDHSRLDDKILEVRVVFSRKGALRKDEIIPIAETWLYGISKDDYSQTREITARDRLFLFLVPQIYQNGEPVPNSPNHIALPGGIKLISGNSVLGFYQHMNPGGYVSETNYEQERHPPPRISEFLEKVENSLKRGVELARIVEASDSTLDRQGLLKLLAEQPGSESNTLDHFAKRASVRLAESHDPKLLNQAIAIAKGEERFTLWRSFGTPVGRDYLLGKVGDDRVPMDQRVQYAEALNISGDVYNTSITVVSDGSYKISGTPSAGNSGYLTRIANEAVAQAGNEKLCLILISGLENSARNVELNKLIPLIPDLIGAEKILRDFYKTKPAEEIRDAIMKVPTLEP